jgi:hypothetical protein
MISPRQRWATQGGAETARQSSSLPHAIHSWGKQ